MTINDISSTIKCIHLVNLKDNDFFLDIDRETFSNKIAKAKQIFNENKEKY